MASILAATLKADQHTCRNAQVTWNDAAIYTRPPNPDFDHFKGFLITQTTVGCVEIRDEVVLIALNFNRGAPDTFMVVPAAWTVRIIWLKEDNNAAPHNPPKTALPEVPTADAARSETPAGHNRRFRDALSHLFGKGL